jgi:hypothetical protein
MKTPILGQAYVARSVNAADNRMVNLFPEAIPNEGKEAGFLNRAPGLSLLTTVGDGPVRGLWSFEGYMYAVSGNTLYKINSAYTATALGIVAGTGQVSMADNGTQLFIAANGPSYIYNSQTNVFQQITDIDFPGALTVSYLDGYFIFNEPNSQKIWVTSLLEGTQIDPLDFASAEGSPDGLVSVIVNNREAWLFGTNSIEVWYDAGTPDFPLARIQGASNEIGCAATFSVAKLDNSIFWLGQDARGRGIIYRNNGYTGVRASNHAVEWQIQQYGDISNAIAYTYQQDGHSFYVLTFPTVQKTWVYDVSTQSWHERAGWSNGNFIRYRPNCQTAFNSEVILGDYESGNLYAYDLDVYADNGQIQKWLRSWRVIPSGQNNLRRTAQHSLQLDCETGVGLNGIDVDDNVEWFFYTSSGDQLVTNTGDLLLFSPPVVQGANPEVMLRWSDDGGHTWSNEHWASMGRIGQYGRRVFWRRLGMTMKLRDRVYEVSGTDPVKIAIVGAELLLSPTRA